MSKELILIAHNLRSAHNVGSLLRTADGLGVHTVYLTGYTPYPQTAHDARLPHLALKTSNQIHKTALGAEKTVSWKHAPINQVLSELRGFGYIVAALEQHPGSIPLMNYVVPDKLAVLVGREVEGVEPDILETCDVIIEIPMNGAKESFNVSQAAAMALYHCKYGE